MLSTMSCGNALVFSLVCGAIVAFVGYMAIKCLVELFHNYQQRKADALDRHVQDKYYGGCQK